MRLVDRFSTLPSAERRGVQAARLLYDLIEARYCARRDEPGRREDAGEKDRVVGRAFGIDRAYHGPVA